MSLGDKNNPGLDMKHGFIHHIRRNQYKRDEYDREVKAMSSTPTHERDKQVASKYPDQQVYRPKTNQKENIEDTTEQQVTKGKRTLLYNLEYTDDSGFVHKIPVHKGDDPSAIAKRLSIAAKVPNELFDTLQYKIKQESLKRDVP